MKTAVFWGFSSCFVFTSAAMAQDSCNPALIAALKNTYHASDATVLSKVVFDTYCNSNSNSTGGTFSGISINHDEAQSACKTHNLKFFEQYNREISFSILPPEAYAVVKEVCAMRTPVEMAIEQIGDSVVAHARFRPFGSVTSARVTSFSYTTDSVTCEKNSPLHARAILQNGGLVANCTRISDDAVVFTINTSQGFQFTSLPPVPPKTYMLSLIQADDYLACTVNGSAVAAITFGQSKDQIVNASLHPGTNQLQCTIRDDHPCTDGQACWSYTYQLRADGSVLAALHDEGHGIPVRQPGPFSFEYIPPHTRRGLALKTTANKPTPSLKW